MLNFIYWPVSGILWFWHKVFGFVLGANSGLAWALAVIFLVYTLRTLLIKPFVGQVRSMRKMQEFQPQIKKLQEKYKNDRQKLAEEMQKLQKEHGVNPLGGCLPVLVQLPVFIGLFHVLRGFQPNFPYNYVFDRTDILSFIDADLFGVRLTDSIAGGNAGLGHYSFSALAFNPHAIPVALPLMVLAAVATHFTARVSQRHQSAAAAANPQAAIMAKLTMWGFPLGLLIFGAIVPVAILIYFLSQNSWTFAQQYLVYNKIAREEAEKREEAKEQRSALAPKVGQKPVRQDRAGEELAPGDTATLVDEPVDAPSDARVDADPVDDEPVDAPSDAPAGATAAPTDEQQRRASGRQAPGKVNGSGRASGSGSRSPGKVSGNGAPGNGGGNGNAGGNGNGGQAKNGQGKGGQGKKKGQLASSGRPAKRKK